MAQGQQGHHSVAQQELNNGGSGTRGHGRKVGRSQGDTHGKHEGGQTSRKVFRGEPGKGLGSFQGNGRENDGPQREQVGGDISTLENWSV